MRRYLVFFAVLSLAILLAGCNGGGGGGGSTSISPSLTGTIEPSSPGAVFVGDTGSSGDAIIVAHSPEPSSLALLAIGLFGIVSAKRRKKTG